VEYPLRCLRLRRHQLQTQASKSADLRSSSALPQYTLTPRNVFPLLGQVHRSAFHQNIFNPWDESTIFFSTPRIVSTMDIYTSATNHLAFWAEILTSERILEKGDSTCARRKQEQESCVEVFDSSSPNLCLLWLSHQPRCGSGRCGLQRCLVVDLQYHVLLWNARWLPNASCHYPTKDTEIRKQMWHNSSTCKSSSYPVARLP